ncbi:MAG: GNAT family N-acetyltransferase [Onishia taeanensis]|uniref:GNAT family N-acetyltransferase n=1 Tax=Onishia taeanensis TaxID=284577 RepID=UPI003C79B0B7
MPACPSDSSRPALTAGAKALMNAARDLAASHGIAQLRLQTQVENHSAQALYASLGWRRDDAFDHYSLSLPAGTAR